MNKDKVQFMSCGACGILVDEDGNVTNSFSLMASGIKRLAATFARKDSGRAASSIAHA